MNYFKTLAAVVLLGVAGCEIIDKDPPPDSPLIGPTWVLRAFVEGDSLDSRLDGRVYSIKFESRAGMVGIRADCNFCDGRYERGRGQTLRISPGPCTLAACPPGTRGEEFVRALSEVQHYRISGRELHLYRDDRERFLLFYHTDR